MAVLLHHEMWTSSTSRLMASAPRGALQASRPPWFSGCVLRFGTIVLPGVEHLSYKNTNSQPPKHTKTKERRTYALEMGNFTTRLRQLHVAILLFGLHLGPWPVW